MGGNEYDKSGHLSTFTFLKHLMMLLKCIFSGLHFYILNTQIACRAMQLRFVKVKTLLNNAFNVYLPYLMCFNKCVFPNEMKINNGKLRTFYLGGGGGGEGGWVSSDLSMV